MRHASTLGSSAVAILAVIGLLGCEEDHPYTPFQVASALPSVAPPPTPAASGPAPRAPSPDFAASAPIALAKGREWLVRDRRIQAPAGYQFERALHADFDSDSAPEIVAWVSPVEDPLKQPELWLYPMTGPSRKLFALPGFVPTGPSCSLRTTLQHTGPRTVTLDTTGVCEARMIARAPVRSVVVLAPATEHPVVLALRAAVGGPQEELKLSVSSLDKDGDGRDDVTLQASVDSVGSGPTTTTAKFLWYDREAGTSRDDTEPGLSLAQLASREILRAKGASTSKMVEPTVQNLKRLYAAVCDEAGTPRLFDDEGNGLSCGKLSTTFSRATEAEILALLKIGRVLDAFGVLERASWFGHEPSPKDRERWLGLFGDRLVQKQARVRRQLALSVPVGGTHPNYSPLEFVGSDTLDVQTQGGVRSFNLDASERQLAEGVEAPERWPLRAAAPGERLWTGVVYSCDRSEVELSFVDGSGQALAPQTTEILAPRPGSCRGGPALDSPAVPIGWSDDQLVAWVAGSLLGPAEVRTRPKGSPRSVNGAWTVLPSHLGLVVTGKSHALWRLPESLGRPEALRGCVIHDSGALVACVAPNGLALIETGEAAAQ